MAEPIREDQAPDDAVPGHRNYLVYCDESGIDGQAYYGFGSLWLPWERRGDFSALINSLRAQHRYHDEIKWTAVNRRSTGFYADLVKAFFEKPWLMFHCLVVRKGYIDKDRHKDFDEARRKHFAMLVKAKVKFFNGGATDKSYHVRVDPLPSRYAKADEAALKIVGATLQKELGLAPLKTLRTLDSRSSPGIQLSDLLLGAIMSAHQDKVSSPHKLGLRHIIAEYMGWPDLCADTYPHEVKLNVWTFHDPSQDVPRELASRAVRLKVPMPLLRRL